MGVSDFIKKIISKQRYERRFDLVVDRDGLNFVLPKDVLETCEKGDSNSWLMHQYVCLQMLEEQGLASRIANGFTVSCDNAVLLEPDVMALMEFPPVFEGSFDTRVQGQTGQSAFSLAIIPILPEGEKVANYQLKGPCLQLSAQEQYLLTPAQWQGFKAYEEHQRLGSEKKTEHQNLKLIGCLQAAQAQGMNIGLSHFDKLKVSQPEKVGVTATELSDGSLMLTPSYGTGSNPDDIETRLGQLNGVSGCGTLRVRNQIVVLDEKRLQATEEILSNKRIPKAQVQTFLKTPSAFLDAALVDLDTGFSLRVKGAVRFQFMQFGETDASGIDWFTAGDISKEVEAPLKKVVRSKEELKEFREKVEEARKQGADSVFFGGEVIDISSPDTLEKEIDALDKSLDDQKSLGEKEDPVSEEKGKGERSTILLSEVEDLGASLLQQAKSAKYLEPIDFSTYLRRPFPHQEEGIRWMLGLKSKALSCDFNDSHRIQGALLADDMGLGKTYMSLVGIKEFYRQLKERGVTEKPVLIVAPLSLIENWEDETNKTFATIPFRDIVVLQAGRDLKRFKVNGAPPETRQMHDGEEVLSQDAIRYALKVGDGFGTDRLDMPKRLVLATYQTLRDYQFSLCRIDWSVVVFDEAQNIKNPNALQTRAAKGLKAHFKLLATGTPVENSLADFWCLMDTAQPGLLGTWPQFRGKYVRPINQAPAESSADVRLMMGQKLRDDVGPFMLRRLKEDNLEGLPEKKIFTGVPNENTEGWSYMPEIASRMNGVQLLKYDEIIDGYKTQKDSGKGRGLALGALMHLREVSLHPFLDEEQNLLTNKAKDAIEVLGRSAKLTNILSILERIRDRQEKVIIFAMTKKLQRYLKIWLEQIFGVKVSIINGDTKAVTSKKDTLTRRGIIEAFEKKPGFGILIMSPIAAGVGLTIVEANNVIHLERHWNPAKEAQATDRVYRIGQKKNVNIYLPALHHPNQLSFDVNLDKLLQKKMNLKDAVVTPQVVSQEEMESVLCL